MAKKKEEKKETKASAAKAPKPVDPQGAPAPGEAPAPEVPETVPAGALVGGPASEAKSKAVSRSQTARQSASFGRDRANRIARNSVTSMDVMAAARNPVSMRTYEDTYGVAVRAPKTVTNQRQSGRCWMFSTLNVLRTETCRLLDIDDFEFSQAYGMFYDKLEKANSFLENVIGTATLPYDDRAVTFLLEHPADDGGQWRFAANLIEKWGVVPKDAMPETACSKDSAQMNRYLARLLRRDAAELRAVAQAGDGVTALRRRKQQMMKDVHRMLCICLGEPPAAVDFICEVGPGAKADEAKIAPQGGTAPTGDAKPKRILRDAGLTPQQFQAAYAPFDSSEYVDLLSCPGEDRPFGHAFGVRWMDSVEGAPLTRFLNVDPEVLEDAAVASLKAGEPLYMACDVAQEFARHISDFPGVLGLDTIDASSLFDVDLGLDKATMYDVRETQLTHAMTFQGVELGADGRPAAWRVENSWGKDACKDGYLIMSAPWFQAYGGEVVVRREFVDEETLKLWDSVPTEMRDPWGAIGACALSD